MSARAAASVDMVAAAEAPQSKRLRYGPLRWYSSPPSVLLESLSVCASPPTSAGSGCCCLSSGRHRKKQTIPATPQPLISCKYVCSTILPSPYFSLPRLASAVAFALESGPCDLEVRAVKQGSAAGLWEFLERAPLNFDEKKMARGSRPSVEIRWFQTLRTFKRTPCGERLSCC